jgi:predicted DNA-binding protein YlxM (UPF0122 family)
MQIDPEKFYSVREIMLLFDVSRTSVLNKIKKGKVRAEKRFSKWYIQGIEVTSKLIKKNY